MRARPHWFPSTASFAVALEACGLVCDEGEDGHEHRRHGDGGRRVESSGGLAVVVAGRRRSVVGGHNGAQADTHTKGQHQPTHNHAISRRTSNRPNNRRNAQTRARAWRSVRVWRQSAVWLSGSAAGSRRAALPPRCVSRHPSPRCAPFRCAIPLCIHRRSSIPMG